MSQNKNQDLLLAEIREWNQNRVTKLFRDFLNEEIKALHAALASEDLLINDPSGKKAAQLLGQMQGINYVSRLDLETRVEVNAQKEGVKENIDE